MSSTVPHPDTFKNAQPETQIHDYPGHEHKLVPKPVYSALLHEVGKEYPELQEYPGHGLLKGKKALITGGDSGIGRAIAVFFARDGADVAINYLPEEQKDAEETKNVVEASGRKCHLFPKDLRSEANIVDVVQNTLNAFGGHIDILVNNASEQHICSKFEEIDAQQIENTFKTNIIGMMLLTKHTLPYISRGGSIINTTSVTAYRGSPSIIDYSATKGAITSFTRSLSQQLAPRGIRVNAVAPGPIWTPLQPASRGQQNLDHFIEQKPPLGRIGQPAEVAGSFVFLASELATYFTGQVLHPNGGDVVNA